MQTAANRACEFIDDREDRDGSTHHYTSQYDATSDPLLDSAAKNKRKLHTTIISQQEYKKNDDFDKLVGFFVESVPIVSDILKQKLCNITVFWFATVAENITGHNET